MVASFAGMYTSHKAKTFCIETAWKAWAPGTPVTVLEEERQQVLGSLMTNGWARMHRETIAFRVLREAWGLGATR